MRKAVATYQVTMICLRNLHEKLVEVLLRQRTRGNYNMRMYFEENLLQHTSLFDMH